MKKQTKTIEITNRKAYHDYFIEDHYEAGIMLSGTEIKSIRAGKANIKDGYAKIENGEIFLHNVHISPYEQGNRNNHEPIRPRKLLLHKKEINKLLGVTKEKGFSLVPLKFYFKNGRCKVEIALVRGKKLYDKRETERKKDAERDIQRTMREKQK